MANTNNKTKFKIGLLVYTESVNEEKELSFDLDLNLEEINELVFYLRKHKLNPQNVKFSDFNMKKYTPTIIQTLYDIAFDIAFNEHLKSLMWVIEDFYDEVKELSSLTEPHQNYDFSTNGYDEEEYYNKLSRNAEVQEDILNNVLSTEEMLRKRFVKDDYIIMPNIICELI